MQQRSRSRSNGQRILSTPEVVFGDRCFLEMASVAEPSRLQQAKRVTGCLGVSASLMLSSRAVGHASATAMPFATNERGVVHVVDDDASMRAALEGLFESVGLDTRIYAAAGEFLSSSLDDKPGCIVIDVRLPDMNGLDFHTQLIQLGVRLPVIMITGYGDIPMSVYAMKRGAVDFLPKPIRDQDMLDAVMAAIERDRRRRTVDGDVSRTRRCFATLTPRE